MGVALAFGYLLGSVPFGLIFGWLAGAGDVRHIGSSNIGATNVLRTGKRWAAAATLILASIVVWSTSNTQAFVAAPTLSQIDPFQLTMSAKDLPTLTFEDRTFVF